jgi:hypothetical protein
MNHVSIFEKKWLDLVFEGKNKSYGAYQLRQENPRTTMYAFLLGLLLLTAAVSIPVILNALGTSSGSLPLIPLAPSDQLHVTEVTVNQQEAQQAVKPMEQQVTEVETQVQLVNPVIVTPIDATQNIATNKDNKPVVDIPESQGGITGINPVAGATEGTGTKPETAAVNTTIINNVNTLDRLPVFPGGIDKFYKYVGKNFEKPEINDAKTVRVFVAFVIERDGTMTDIRVARDPGYGLAKEAIRVLKSLKVQWEPGMIGGQAVRTAYNLPITVNME